MAKKRTRKRIRRPDAYGVRAIARMNRAAGKKAQQVSESWDLTKPVVIPIAVQHTGDGPVLIVPKDVPVKRAPASQTWMEFFFGTTKW